MIAQRVTETEVKVEWYDGFWQLVEVSPEDVGCIMDRIASPVEAFAVPIRTVKCRLKLFDTFFASCQPEDAFYVGRYTDGQNAVFDSRLVITYPSLSGTLRIWRRLWVHSRICSFDRLH